MGEAATPTLTCVRAALGWISGRGTAGHRLHAFQMPTAVYESSVSHFLTNNNTTVTYDGKYVRSTFFNS